MYSMYIIHIQSIHYIILVKRRAKSCDPKTEITVLNKMLYILRVQIVLLYCTRFEQAW